MSISIDQIAPQPQAAERRPQNPSSAPRDLNRTSDVDRHQYADDRNRSDRSGHDSFESHLSSEQARHSDEGEKQSGTRVDAERKTDHETVKIVQAQNGNAISQLDGEAGRKGETVSSVARTLIDAEKPIGLGENPQEAAPGKEVKAAATDGSNSEVEQTASPAGSDQINKVSTPVVQPDAGEAAAFTGMSDEAGSGTESGEGQKQAISAPAAEGNFGTESESADADTQSAVSFEEDGEVPAKVTPQDPETPRYSENAQKVEGADHPGWGAEYAPGKTKAGTRTVSAAAPDETGAEVDSGAVLETTNKTNSVEGAREPAEAVSSDDFTASEDAGDTAVEVSGISVGQNVPVEDETTNPKPEELTLKSAGSEEPEAGTSASDSTGQIPLAANGTADDADNGKAMSENAEQQAVAGSVVTPTGQQTGPQTGQSNNGTETSNKARTPLGVAMQQAADPAHPGLDQAMAKAAAKGSGNTASTNGDTGGTTGLVGRRDLQGDNRKADLPDAVVTRREGLAFQPKAGAEAANATKAAQSSGQQSTQSATQIHTAAQNGAQPQQQAPAAATPVMPVDLDALLPTSMPDTSMTRTGSTMDIDPVTGALHMSGNGSAKSLLPSHAEVTLNFARTRMLQAPAKDMAVQIAKHAGDGINKFDIRITPPELGRIEVRLEIADNGKVSAHLVADKQETLDLLQRDRATLEKALAEAGLDADGSSLDFSMREGGDQQDQDRNFRNHGLANADGTSEGVSTLHAADHVEMEVSAYGFDIVRMKRLDIAV